MLLYDFTPGAVIQRMLLKVLYVVLVAIMFSHILHSHLELRNCSKSLPVEMNPPWPALPITL